MGFNIAGVVLNKNYQDNLTELQDILGLQLDFEQNIIFEEAVSSKYEDDICDIYFGKSGTWVNLHINHCFEPFCLEGLNVVAYIISEVSMSFLLHYYEGRNQKRHFLEFEAGRERDEGERLPQEDMYEDDCSNIILAVIGEVLGEEFGEIDLGSPAYRYKIK